MTTAIRVPRLIERRDLNAPMSRADLFAIAQVGITLAALSWLCPQVFHTATFGLVLAIPIAIFLRKTGWSPHWTTVLGIACIAIAPFYALPGEAAILESTQTAFETAVASLGGGAIDAGLAEGIFNFIRIAIFIGLIGGIVTAAIQFFTTGQYQTVLTVTIGAMLVLAIIEFVSGLVFV